MPGPGSGPGQALVPGIHDLTFRSNPALVLEDHVEAKKAFKSFHYKNSLVWNSGRRGRTSAPGKPEMDVGSPIEFRGEPGVWSPEELLVGALNACLMLTFVSLAQNKGIQFVAYES